DAPCVAKGRIGERTDHIDLTWLSPAERAALRRQLDRLRASRAAQESSSSEASENRKLEASCGLIATVGAARTSREDEVRYRVDPNIWDLPQFAFIPYDQLVSDYLAWLSTRTERGGAASSATIKAARDTLGSFRKALVAEDQPLVASSISARSYDCWVRHLLGGGLAVRADQTEERSIDRPSARIQAPAQERGQDRPAHRGAQGLQ